MADPVPDARAVAASFLAVWRALAETTDGGFSLGPPGAPVVCTGLPIPALNGVIALDPREASVPVLTRGLARVAATGVPYGLQARPECAAAAGRAAQVAGLQPGEAPTPLMATARPVRAPPVPGLAIRRLGPGEIELHGEIAAPAFDAPAEPFHAVARAAVHLAGTRFYVGEVDGEPVGTGLGVTVGAAVAVFDIATPAQFRGRGYGAAMTARAIEDGFAAGARLAWLQSSPSGFGVYRRLGLHELERWPGWVAP